MYKHTGGRGLALLLAVILLFIGSPLSVWAAPARQTDNGMRLLDTVEGTLDAATPEASYTFSLVANQVISTVAWSNSGNLALGLTLYDPGGQPLVEGKAPGSDATRTIIEGFTVPAAGTYSVTVRAANNTSGTYSLTLLPGFSYLDKWEDFETTGDSLSMQWEPSTSDLSQSSLTDGQLRIEVLEPDTLSYIGPSGELSWTDLYIEARVEIEGAPSYYEYGILLRSNLDDQVFYAALFSSDNDWAVFYYSDGWEPIQEWTVSDAIDDDTTPVISVILQGSTFKLYFNDNFVGEVSDTGKRLTAGKFALAAATTVDQTDHTIVRYDDVVITTPSLTTTNQGLGPNISSLFSTATAITEPSPAPVIEATPTKPGSGGLPFGAAGRKTPTPGPAQDKPTSAPLMLPTNTTGFVQPTNAFVLPTNPPLPTLVPATEAPAPTPAPLPTEAPATADTLANWSSSNPQDILAELQQKGLIPSRGTMIMDIGTSFGDTSSSGFNYYPLGQGRTIRNLVIGFDEQLYLTGSQSGCGMHFRRTNTSRTVALVTEEGGLYLAQFNNNEAHPASVYNASSTINPGQGVFNRVLVVANEADVRMYVNGELLAYGQFDVVTGSVALELFVAQDESGYTQRTYCELNSLWVWEF